MTAAQRKEKAYLHKQLTDLLTDCNNDMDYLRRLMFAHDIISDELMCFTDEERFQVETSLGWTRQDI